MRSLFRTWNIIPILFPGKFCVKKKVPYLKVIPINEKGELIIEEYKKLLSPKTKLVAVNHASNALGTINPVKEIIDAAHKAVLLF